jgi:hypothetical protein
MKYVAIYSLLSLVAFAMAGAFLRRSARTELVTLPPAAKRAAPVPAQALDRPTLSGHVRPRTEGTSERKTPLGTSLLDGDRWNDLKRASLSDPRATLLTGALVRWVSGRTRHCLPTDKEALATSAIQVVVTMTSTAEAAAIDGRAADVRVIEGAPLDDKTLGCVKAAIAVEDTVPLSSVDPGTLERLGKRLPKGTRPTFPDGFRGSAGMTMNVRCRGN